MKMRPLCRFCGKPIAKATRCVWLHARPLEEYEKHEGGMLYRHLSVAVKPKAKAECQKLTNWQVVSVSRAPDGDGIDSFGEWDGESYVDEFFCNGDHARRFGYVCAAGGEAMRAYTDAIRAQRGEAA